MDLAGRWWNGLRSHPERRDIWLTSDGHRWHVRAREGGTDGREVSHDFTREYEARAMVDRLMAAAPGNWKDITRIVRGGAVDHSSMTTDRSTDADAAATDRRTGDRIRWTVWRQDDNGNRFEVARFDSREQADALAATMEARGHKQTYWVAAADR